MVECSECHEETEKPVSINEDLLCPECVDELFEQLNLIDERDIESGENHGY